MEKEWEIRDFQLGIEQSVLNYTLANRKFESLMTQDQYEVYQLGLLVDIGLKDAEARYKRAMASMTWKQKEQLDFVLDMAKEMWKYDKKYYPYNAHNEYVTLFYGAKQARLSTELFDRYKTAEWWIRNVGGSLTDLSQGIGYGIGAGLRGKGSKSGYSSNSSSTMVHF